MKKLWFVLTIFLFVSCEKTVSSKSTFALNTVCTVSLYESGTEELYTRIFNRITELEKVFDSHNNQSEISIVNKNAQKDFVEISPDFYEVISKSLAIAKISDGAFNPCCGRLVNLWGINTENAHVPTEKEIEVAVKFSDWKGIDLISDEKSGIHKIKLSPGIQLDLGGAAKGFVADEIVKILREERVKYAVLDLGGNIYVFGEKKDKSLWKVGVKNPLNPAESTQIILQIPENSVVTSGNYERYFISDGKRYHHILDCKTGYPAETGLSSVTIISKNSLLADILSTTLFVLGEEKIADVPFNQVFQEKIEYILIRSDGTEKRDFID